MKDRKHIHHKAMVVVKKEKSKKKWILILGMMLLITILAIIFMKNSDKVFKSGNTKINKTAEGISQHILMISSFEANAEIKVISNKNENRYVVKQQYVAPNVAKQVVQEPENIRDITITFDGEKLKLENSKLQLSTVYENYQPLTENHLFLNYFIEDYKLRPDVSKTEEKNGMIVMETKCKESSNKYTISKKLYINKETAIPVKMEVQDFNQNTIVYILYNEIKINSSKKEEVLAFKSMDILTDL